MQAELADLLHDQSDKLKDRLNNAIMKETQNIFQVLSNKIDSRLGTGPSRTPNVHSQSRVPTPEPQRPSRTKLTYIPPSGHKLPSNTGTPLIPSVLLQYWPWVEAAHVKNIVAGTFDILHLPKLLRDEDAR
jgi:hypothetical protein